MPGFHNSGSLRVSCSACHKENELTALNLPMAEVVNCSHCHAPLGAWETLLAASVEADATALPGGDVPV